ncbi:YqgE/AlgH family protein [Neisseria sp. Ec49-e6-T10]|uniref:YqgE/AlgH family protein n=1 Tax=Neisseria sp. Ec49-e6-T10 TaxID=3140744 RepID=UPI003EBCEE6C
MNKIKMQPLVNHFLIAMPDMQDPFFQEGVVYLCEHNEEGAMGFLVNKPSSIFFGQLFDQVRERIPKKHDDDIVFFGGPVQSDRGFLLHAPVGQWQSSLVIDSDIAITTSKDILTGIAKDNGPEDLLVALGYSAWDKGQLEDELARNDWLTVPASKEVIFHTPPKERYQKALSLLGITPDMLVSKAGHA